MTHDEFESIAALDALGAASAEEESALREHLQTCAQCSQARDEFAEAATLLATDLEPVPPPSQVRQAIMETLEPGETTLVERQRRSRVLGRGPVERARVLQRQLVARVLLDVGKQRDKVFELRTGEHGERVRGVDGRLAARAGGGNDREQGNDRPPPDSPDYPMGRRFA